MTAILEPDPQFEKLVNEILKACENSAKAILGKEGREFMDLRELAEGDDYNAYSPEELAKLFVREAINKKYSDIVTADEPQVNDMVSVQLARHQLDFMAGHHRDFAARTRTRIRAAAHHAASLAANGKEKGPIGTASIRRAQNILKSADEEDR